MSSPDLRSLAASATASVRAALDPPALGLALTAAAPSRATVAAPEAGPGGASLHERFRAELDALSARAGVEVGVIASSPASIMALLRRAIRGVDRQVERITLRLERSLAEADRLTKMEGALSGVLGRIGPEARNSISLDATYKEGITVREYLASAGVDLQALGVEHDGRVSRKALQGVIDEVKAEIRTTNSGNELAMVQLQQLFQQRSESMQLGTSLLKALHEMQMSAIQNIGR